MCQERLCLIFLQLAAEFGKLDLIISIICSNVTCVKLMQN